MDWSSLMLKKDKYPPNNVRTFLKFLLALNKTERYTNTIDTRPSMSLYASKMIVRVSDVIFRSVEIEMHMP